MRFKNGAWRPIGTKQTVYSAKPFYNRIEIHKKDNIENWIGYNSTSKTVEHYDPDTLSVTQTVVTLNGTEILNDIQFLKTFLIIITSENLYRFVWEDHAYTQITLTGIKSQLTALMVTDNYIGQRVTEFADNAEALIGKYYKLLNELSEDGQFIGGIFFRVAIRLFDGTEILQTIPEYYQTVNYNASISKGPQGYYFSFHGGAAGFKMDVTYTNLLDTTPYESLKSIIQSIVVYSSRVNQFYDISEDTITDENLTSWLPSNGTVILSTIIDISNKFKEDMHDSTNWYKIGEVAFNKLSEETPGSGVFVGEMTMDLEGFYENFATREQIDVDNFSHHDLSGNASDIYNDRLELGDTRQTLSGSAAEPILYFPAATAIYDAQAIGPIKYYILESVNKRNCLIQIKFDTANGIKYTHGIAQVYAYQRSTDSNKKAIFLPGLIGYPDSRAIEMVVNIEVDGAYYEIERFTLEKSVFGNYAFRINPNFDKTATDNSKLQRVVDQNFVSTYIPYDITDLTANSIVVIEDAVNVITDSNRVQISEVNNPFFFPAENSQQVSTGIIRAFGTNTEDVSSGQFGQYPIYIFTSKGIWAFEIGAGDVYITNVLPINGEVIKDNYSKLNLSFGVAYITSEGLRIISGKEVIEISEPVEGMQDQTFSDNLNLQFFLNHAAIVQMLDYIDKVPFNTYLSGAAIGYNKGTDNNELIVSNPDYDYSYIYDIKHKYWFKMSGQHSVLITNYPELYAVNEDGSGKVVNFSIEESGITQCLLITRAHNFGEEDVSKKINRAFVKGFMNTTADHYAAAYLFGSDNLKEWKFITGNDRNTGQFKDIWITKSLASYRYFIVVFAAELDTSKENYISVIACEYETKMNQKLR